MQQEIQVPPAETVSISQLKVDGSNPNKMDRQTLDRLKRSIQQFGFIVPIITNKDLLIADGEQRWIAANELAMKEVSVIRLPVEDVDRRLLRQVLNKLKGEHELLADAQEFEKILSAGREDDLKFLLDLNDSKLERYLRELHPPQDETYEVSEIEKVKTDIKRGDILQLGKHRLMCGDATNKADVEALMDGQKADMVFTDPPYNYANTSILPKIFAQVTSNTHIFLMHDDTGIVEYLRNSSFQFNRFFVLDFVFASPRGNDPYLRHILLSHEKIGTPKKHENLYDGLSSIIKIEYRGHLTEERVHPHQKAVKNIELFIKHYSDRNDVILDVFAGAGSTLLACERNQRICYALEIDPRCCEIIKKRWESFTGLKAEILLPEALSTEPNQSLTTCQVAAS